MVARITYRRRSTYLTGIVIHVSVLLGLLTANANAQVTSTWNGTTGNWTDAARWSTNPLFPNNGNGGNTYNAVVSGGTVTLNQAITIEDLTLSGGIITGSSNLDVLDDLSWTSGRFAGSGTTAVAGGTISGSATKRFTSRTLEIAGDVDWSAGEILRPLPTDPFGTIVVNDGATFTASGVGGDNRYLEADMVVNTGGRFLNTGSRWTDLEGNLTNNGIVEVAEDGFMFFSGGSGSGDLIIRDGAGAIFVLEDASDYQFAGRIILDGGIFDILVFGGGGVEFLLPSYISGNGTFDAHGGTLVVEGTIAPGFSIGHIDIEGNLELTTNGKMVIEATSESIRDTIAITGAALLEGSLTLDITGSTLQGGDSIQILTAQSITEDIDTIEVVGNDDLFFSLRTEELASNMIALYSEGHDRGDLDLLGGVTEEDVPAFALALTNPSIYRSTYGIGAHQSGDIDGDLDCDVDDIDDFADLLGMSLAELTHRIQFYSAKVPEPGSAALWALGAITLTLSRQRARGQEQSEVGDLSHGEDPSPEYRGEETK